MNESSSVGGARSKQIPAMPPSVAEVSTAIPAFIGYTQKATDSNGQPLPINTPTQISSLQAYQQQFGHAEYETSITVKITANTTPAPSTTALTTVGAPNPHSMYYALRAFFDNGGDVCYIVSVGPTTGTISDVELTAGIHALEAYDEPTLIIVPEGRSVSSAALYYSMMQVAVDQCFKLQDRFTLVDVYDQSADTNTNIANFRANPGLSNHLDYAAAYYPCLKTNYAFSYDETTVTITLIKNNVTTVTTLAALLPTDSISYYAAKNAISSLPGLVLPPTPAIAGAICRSDSTNGVWKAPANIALNDIYDVTDLVTDQEHAAMNIDAATGKSVNAIRAFPGKGILIWGARTLNGNDNDWKYISVRRFCMMVQESTKNSTEQFVFEPNDASTWAKIKAMIENYLISLWRRGALAGSKPEQAFFVSVGLGQTMTALDVLEGNLIVEIGLAVVKPAEFIIIRFTQKMQQA